MRAYELVVLLHPDLEIDADSPIAKIEKLAETAGGKVIKRDNWGKKRLAYKVKHQEFAVYVYFELQFEPNKAPGFERNLLLTEEIMRHLLVSKEEEQAQAPAKKPKAAVSASDEVEVNEDKDNG